MNAYLIDVHELELLAASTNALQEAVDTHINNAKNALAHGRAVVCGYHVGNEFIPEQRLYSEAEIDVWADAFLAGFIKT